MESSPTDAQFPNTNWSLVLAAAHLDSSASKIALEELCQAYRPPIYAYLRCKRGRQPHDADDLVQSFLSTLITRNDFARANPTRGPFRRYLLTCLKNWLINYDASQKAAKRGSGKVVAIEPELTESFAGADHHTTSPDHAYDQSYWHTLYSRAEKRLENERTARGKSAEYSQLKGFLEGASPADYLKASAALNKPANTIAQSVVRLRKRLLELFEDEVRQTVATQEDFECEMQNFRETWRR